MTTTAPVIDPLRFAAALPALPLDALHAKAAELQNSIGHLRFSNEQMLPFADAGDQDCKEAMFENLSVIGRMNERVAMLKAEVEGRGQLWPGDGEMRSGNGVGSEAGEQIVVSRETVAGGERMVNGDGVQVNGVARSGRWTDEELVREMDARLANGGDEEYDGVHL